MLNNLKFPPVGTYRHAGRQRDGDDKTNSAFAIFPMHLKHPASSPCPWSFCLELGDKTLSKI
jgi:hypothetical protein